MIYHVDSHVASCFMEIHMVNHEVGMRCTYIVHGWVRSMMHINMFLAYH